MLGLRLLLASVTVAAMSASGIAATSPANAATCVTSTAERIKPFSGLNWWTRHTNGQIAGPGPNVFDCRNVTPLTNNGLRLAIVKRSGVWTSSQVHPMPAQWGHGTYRWVVSRSSLAKLPDSAVLGLFTWSDAPEYGNRELDIEITRWGVPPKKKKVAPPIWFSVQRGAGIPPYQKQVPLPTSGTSVALTIDWREDRVRFLVNDKLLWESLQGSPPEGGDVLPAMNLWLTNGAPAAATVDLLRFTYRPA